MTENLQKTPGSVATISLVGDLASLLQLQNYISLGRKLWLESPEYQLVFLLRWVRPVLSYHKHHISCMDYNGKNTIDLRTVVSLFLVEPVARSLQSYASSFFTCVENSSLSLVHCLRVRIGTYIKICWQIKCQKRLLDSTVVTVFLTGVIFTYLSPSNIWFAEEFTFLLYTMSWMWFYLLSWQQDFCSHKLISRSMKNEKKHPLLFATNILLFE